ncbi:MAG: hypothetical protein PHW04_10145 [Candidatus Wallbacteria bacterium]|nr:hypothetical protein [Candidatus Wallbacteria bacterium]
MKNKFYLFFLLIFCTAVFSEEVPAYHPSYKQLHELVKLSGIPELSKYMDADSGLTSAEMAQALASILINQSYLELDTRESERRPLFFKMRSKLPELRELTEFLKLELKDFSIDYDFLVSEYDRLSRWVAEDPELASVSKMEVVTLDQGTSETETQAEVNSDREQVREETAREIKEKLTGIKAEDVPVPKKDYSPTGSFRLIEMQGTDIPAERWVNTFSYLVYKDNNSKADSIDSGFNCSELIYSPNEIVSYYLGADLLEKEKSGIYRRHYSTEAGMKILSNRFARNFFKFSLGCEGKFFSQGWNGTRVDLYMASAYYAPAWKGTQLLNNIRYVTWGGQNKFLTSFGIEAKIFHYPLYFLGEANQDFQSGNYNVINTGIRYKRKHLNTDLTLENDRNKNRRAVGVNFFWGF